MTTEEFGSWLLRVADYAGRVGELSFRTGEVTAANFAAEYAKHTAMNSAIADLMNGVTVENRLIARRSVLVEAPVTGDENVNRGNQWLVTATGTDSHRRFTFRIYTADATDLLLDGTNVADMTKAKWAAFKSAFSALVKHPETGEPAVIVGAVLIRRSQGETAIVF